MQSWDVIVDILKSEKEKLSVFVQTVCPGSVGTSIRTQCPDFKAQALPIVLNALNWHKTSLVYFWAIDMHFFPNNSNEDIQRR